MQLVECEQASVPPEVAAYLESIDSFLRGDVAYAALARVEGRLVGHVVLGLRPITPMFMGSIDLFDFAGKDTGRPILEGLREGFVLDFRVVPDHRRRGIGTALQRAAVRWCKSQGLHQMRGWSSYDTPETYRIKLRLGFGAVPSAQYIESLGKWVPGAYFVYPLRSEACEPL